MNTTETKEYIEPTGFLGTKGEWFIEDSPNRSIATKGGEVGYKYITGYTSGEANAILLSQSKELVKALQGLIDQYEEAAKDYFKVHKINLDEGMKELHTLINAKEVLNKALNINQ